ncbi:hypothetical protein KVT40_007174 [Elsinoe batatas]|uniref:Uncharacterized protein n=1 Tax=Elsinoe batatas TaxID=2601811 RepID=A0A8K0PFL9_9PEZI|nr:hypothetical protein KVT40_007174 [Elsinoe batatas]
MGRITISPYVRGSRLSWRVRTTTAADDVAVWNSGRRLMSITETVAGGETGGDRHTFTLNVGDWVEAHYHSLGHTEYEFAKVCAIRRITDDKGKQTEQLCISWGVEISTFDKDSLPAQVKRFIKDNDLEGLTVCASDHFDIIGVDQVEHCIANTDSTMIIATDCVPENRPSNAKLCGGLYASIVNKSETTKELHVGEVFTEEDMGSEEEEEVEEPRPRRQTVQEAIDAGNEEEEEEEDEEEEEEDENEDNLDADRAQSGGRGASEESGDDFITAQDSSVEESDAGLSTPVQPRVPRASGDVVPHPEKGWL